MAEMTDIGVLSARVERVEQKLDALSTRVDTLSIRVDTLSTTVGTLSTTVDALSRSVDERFDAVDKRFDEVSEHFVEQREYTEFAFETLRREMLDGFGRLERSIETNTSGLVRLERKFDSFEGKFDEFLRLQSRPHRRQRSPRTPKKR